MYALAYFSLSSVSRRMELCRVQLLLQTCDEVTSGKECKLFIWIRLARLAHEFRATKLHSN
jgi:hypothetical protein